MRRQVLNTSINFKFNKDTVQRNAAIKEIEEHIEHLKNLLSIAKNFGVNATIEYAQRAVDESIKDLKELRTKAAEQSVDDRFERLKDLHAGRDTKISVEDIIWALQNNRFTVGMFINLSKIERIKNQFFSSKQLKMIELLRSNPRFKQFALVDVKWAQFPRSETLGAMETHITT